MKRLFFLMVLAKHCYSQDTIFLINGNRLLCNVKSANNNKVIYSINNNDSIRFAISANKIDSIKFKSGYIVDRDNFHPSHIHSKYSSSFDTDFINENVKLKHLVSLNSVGFFSHKIGLNFTYFFNKKNYALFVNLSPGYNYKDENYLRRTDGYGNVFASCIGLQIIGYTNTKNAFIFMPSINYESLWRNIYKKERIVSYTGNITTQDTRINKYYKAITPSLYFGGMLFITEKLFLNPLIGFGFPITLGKQKISSALVQFQLNVGIKVK